MLGSQITSILGGGVAIIFSIPVGMLLIRKYKINNINYNYILIILLSILISNVVPSFELANTISNVSVIVTWVSLVYIVTYCIKMHILSINIPHDIKLYDYFFYVKYEIIKIIVFNMAFCPVFLIITGIIFILFKDEAGPAFITNNTFNFSNIFSLIFAIFSAINFFSVKIICNKFFIKEMKIRREYSLVVFVAFCLFGFVFETQRANWMMWTTTSIIILSISCLFLNIWKFFLGDKIYSVEIIRSVKDTNLNKANIIVYTIGYAGVATIYTVSLFFSMLQYYF